MLVFRSNLIHETEFAEVAELTDAYAPDKTPAVLRMLVLVPDLVLRFIIGGRPTSLQDYIDKSTKFNEIHSRMSQFEKPRYTDAGIPDRSTS
jgi:hypothetical protein